MGEAAQKIYLTRADIESYKERLLDQIVLVRLPETAAVLAVSESTIMRRVEEQKLTPYNDNATNKNVRFLASELKLYVKEMRGKLKDD